MRKQTNAHRCVYTFKVKKCCRATSSHETFLDSSSCFAKAITVVSGTGYSIRENSAQVYDDHSFQDAHLIQLVANPKTSANPFLNKKYFMK